jgi:3-hydroxyisobutyrate dehydrogenase-like beta-hydroxyacid dehydrogenase
MTDRVGIIGLGIMGSAISENLIQGRLAVFGYDVDASRNYALESAGGRPRASAKDVAADAEVVLTSLPSAEALEVATLGEAGVAAIKGGARIVVECSTLPIADKERIAGRLKAAGHVMLDCPLSGTGAQARTKDLVVFASGERAAYDRCTRIFEGFARAHRYLGAFGNGSRMKFIANLLVQIHNVAAAEAILLGRSAGLDAKQVYDVIRDSAGTSRMFEVRGPMMVERVYRPATMKNDVWQKDMQIIGDFARSLGSPTPLFDLSEQLYRRALADGRGDEDTAAVYAVLEAQRRTQR